MAIDHMIFNSKKWYEGQMPSYLGKSIKAINPYGIVKRYYIDPVGLGSQGTSYLKDIAGTEILIEYLYENELYVSNMRGFACYKVSELLQNGGVWRSLLSHIRRGLQSLLRNEVTACL